MKEHVASLNDGWLDLQSPSILDIGSGEGLEKEATILASDALKTLRRDRELTRAVLLVPFPMIYFCVYVLMLATHIPTSDLVKQNNALYTTLASSGSTTVTVDSPMLFFNIQTPADIWKWIELTLVPSILATQDYNGVDLPVTERARVATRNQVLGAVSFKVTYGTPETCNIPDFLLAIYETCYSTSNTSTAIGFLSITANTSEAVEIIEGLKNGTMVDSSTEEVEITVVTFNGEIGSYGVTTLKLDFQEGGFIEPTATTIGAIADPYAGSKSYVVDALLGICFLVVLRYQLARLWRNRHGLLAHLSDFWHIVDYASTILIIAFYVVWGVIIHVTNASWLQTYIAGFSATNIEWTQYDGAVDALDAMIRRLEWIGHLTVALRLISTVTILLLGVRILDRFRFHPRLNLLSHTISRSLAKFGAFGFVFLIVIVTFALSGHFIFGDRAKEFSTIKASLEACVNILFGNFDFASIENLIVPVPIIYYWGYLIIANLILLNMMLAIVLDTYEEVSDEAYKDKTIASMSRIASIIVYNVLLWFYNIGTCGCFRRVHRLSLDLAGNLGGNVLTHQEIVFRGRIRPDVLEAVLDATEVGKDEMQTLDEVDKLTPLKLGSMFANAFLTDAEARATIVYLVNGLVPHEDASETKEEATVGIIRQRRNKSLRATQATPSPVHGRGEQWGTSTSTETQELTERIAGLERQLELILAHVSQK